MADDYVFEYGLESHVRVIGWQPDVVTNSQPPDLLGSHNAGPRRLSVQVVVVLGALWEVA